MTSRVNDVLRFCCELSAHDQNKVAVKNLTRGALVAGGAAFVGGMLAGPPGIAVGGAVGGLLGYMTRSQFRSLPQILMDLPPSQQQRLYQDIMAILGNLNWPDADHLIALAIAMAPQVDDVLHLCCELSAHDQIKVALKNSTRGAMVAGGAAFVGGMLAGPPGVAAGGAVVGLLGSYMAGGQFRPLPQILMDLPPSQQQILFQDIMAILGNLNWTDAAQLIALMIGKATLQQQVIAALLNYITNELKAEVRYED